MFLLKSNVPKLVWHHVASFDWKIAPMKVASAEIGGVLFAPHYSNAGTYKNEMVVLLINLSLKNI